MRAGENRRRSRVKVFLSSRVVLSIVTAERSLTAEETLYYTFRSHGETTLSETTEPAPTVTFAPNEA